MKRFRSCPLMLLVLALFGSAPVLRAADLKAQVDCTADGKLLDSRFGRYGYSPTRSMIRDAQAIRFQLPAETEGVAQTGLYSYFAVAGDFEITAAYEIASVPTPETGYGVAIGMAVEGKQTGESVALTWSHIPKRGITYAVTRGQKSGGTPKYESTYHPTRAESGRLALRRERAELICLAADGDAATFQELCRVPFTDGTVRTLRIFADPGGSPTSVEAQVGNIRVRAEEITGGIPQRDKSSGIGWWLIAALGVAAVALFIYWRKRREA